MPSSSGPVKYTRAWMLFIVTTTLCSGALATLTAKTLFQINSLGRCGDSSPFNKPFFLTMSMFIGEACCLIGYYAVVRPKLRKEAVQPDPTPPAPLSAPLLDDDEPFSPPSLSSSTLGASSAALRGSSGLPPCPTYVFTGLCCIDMTGSVLNYVGLAWVSASLNQMFRGSMAVFVALFSLCLLRRRLSVEQWVAIAAVVFGLSAVGFSSYLQPTAQADGLAGPSTELVFLGIILIVASSALNALQNVVEELLMKMLVNYQEPHPLEIVGWEGVYGTLIASLVLLPAVYYIPGSDCGGRLEDSLDTLSRMADPAVLLLVIGYVGGIGYMNYASMELSRMLSAVVRNLVSALRTVLVWVVGVLLYYGVGAQYGERLGLWSVVELLGFLMLIAGSMLYSRARERTVAAKVKGLDGKPSTTKKAQAAQAANGDADGDDDEDSDDDIIINGRALGV